MKVHRIDHVGIVVNDLPAAKAFFLDFGFELQEEGSLVGAWLGRIVGLNDVKTSYAFFRVPGGQTSQENIELIKYHTPSDENGIQQPLANANANTLGIRHIAFAVEEIEEAVAKLKEKGTETFSEIQDYEGIYKLCYVRGHERSGGGHHSRVGRADQLEHALWNRRAYSRLPLNTLGAPTSVGPPRIRSTRA